MMAPQRITQNKKGKLKPGFTNTEVTFKTQELPICTGNVELNS